MVDLTVVILTKNEEKNLRKCIESFRGIAKRFVVVDSFSTDNTKLLCEQLNKELNDIGSSLDFYENQWVDYATQLNWGLTHTKIDTVWSMRMDSDEELLEELTVEIDRELEKLPPNISGIILRRRTMFMGRWIKHGGRYPEYLLRIFRTGKAFCEQKAMDEHMILLEGKAIKFKNDIVDNNKKDLEWWIAKHNWYSNREVFDYQKKCDVIQQIEQGTTSKQAKIKRVLKNKGYYKLPKFFRAHLYYIYRYYFRLGFLDGVEGKIFHFLQAYWYRFLVDAKMYECEKTGKQIKPQGDLKM